MKKITGDRLSALQNNGVIYPGIDGLGLKRVFQWALDLKRKDLWVMSKEN